MNARLHRARIATALAVGAILFTTLGGTSAGAPTAPVQIKVLSNRADLVSGGDALVEVVLPAPMSSAGVWTAASALNPSMLKVSLGGKDITSVFAPLVDELLAPAAPRIVGKVEGLALGKNVVTARLGDGRGARIEITNHPIGGPVFGGPQVKPWICTTEENDLGKPRDAQCNGKTIYEFLYKSTNPVSSGLQPYDPANPPSDVATTETDQGRTVPFIVRHERGTIDRAIYDIAVLFDPSKPWTPAAAQPGWNHKLTVPFGGSCGPWHIQSVGPSVLDELALSRGFAVATSGLNTLGNNCNEAVSAEALMMLKEHLIETYGPIRYTIGSGCSGGSIQQHNIASAYPGLLDGILPSCSFTDVWTTAMEVGDCRLLLNYFQDTSPHLWANPAQRAFVAGHMSAALCHTWISVYGFDREGGDPTIGCTAPLLSSVDVPYVGVVQTQQEPEWVYDPETNPKGTRCTIQDYAVAIWGRRAKDGFAKRPSDNVGVQYGLQALDSGLILAEQFVDLNSKIGGVDIDFKPTTERVQADEGAVEIAYRSGRVSNGRELAKVPIIDLRGHNNNEIHADYHSYSMRERLKAVNGHANNHVIFLSPVPLVVPPSVSEEAFLLMDEWLAAIEKDTSADSLAEKVVKNKPAGAVDACYLGTHKVTDWNLCSALFPHFSSPRIVAGQPLADDVIKCQLKPLRKEDYGVTFTADQWSRLEKAFPTGVCDWNKPGVAQDVEPISWATFAAGPGGRPLGPAPVSVPVASASSVLGERLARRVPAGELPATGVGSGAVMPLLAGLALGVAVALRRVLVR